MPRVPASGRPGGLAPTLRFWRGFASDAEARIGGQQFERLDSNAKHFAPLGGWGDFAARVGRISPNIHLSLIDEAFALRAKGSSEEGLGRRPRRKRGLWGGFDARARRQARVFTSA